VAEEKEVAEEGKTAEEVPEVAEATPAPETVQEVAAAGAETPVLEDAAETAPARTAEAPRVEDAGPVETTAEATEGVPSEGAEAAEYDLPMAELTDRGGDTDIYYYGTGRRKTASAQVRLYPSKEPAILVNDMRVDEYFSRAADINLVKIPLVVTATEDMFRITVKVRGGGITGQAGAVRHGIARALTKANPELRRTLRREGSLTRDPRMKERKKPGLKRARKAPQYTKR
jgi:small subunit ribosomal protein S9